MPRTARSIAAGGFYHVLNRGDGRHKLFVKDADYDAFCHILADAPSCDTRSNLYAWCLLPDHWHMVLSPEREGENEKE
ncbi:transposase [Humisphaera borealis]|uniref:Transposase n=1 Tax=Humisphaera borealis TaxID=2807512 RepID=A0A7M2WSR2_9BACT|nr:transposase [Humisphaera borealis]QOV88459.1 transposase [Humisphaera borealis]